MAFEKETVASRRSTLGAVFIVVVMVAVAAAAATGVSKDGGANGSVWQLHIGPVRRPESMIHITGPCGLLGYASFTNAFCFDTQTTTEGDWEMQLINGRMDVEVNDYPGSGANNRHTPKPPQLGRSCGDC
ncbi:hypothetical protein L1049_027647 [Liquidambar formosana]|uniref:Uncharacterized protein n=1 Tax=Liquidambar formosana TaxID=63359 RepID=A0AAP0RI84_LIQFO